MLTNALLAGALGAGYLTIVVLQLNPHVPLVSETTWRLFGVLALFYGVHLAVLFYLSMIGRELITQNVMSPGWMSTRVLAWLSAAQSAGIAVLMWLNVTGLATALDETTIRRMTAGAAATTATAVVLLGLAIAHYSFGRRGSKVGAALLTIAVFGSLALPVAARGPGVDVAAPPRAAEVVAAPAPAAGPRVVMLLLDGASLEYIGRRAAGGRLPNFARLLESGASMDLATVRPTAVDPVWAAVATGMYAPKNGVRSVGAFYVRGDTRALTLLPDHCFAHLLVRLGLLRREEYAASAMRVRPLWGILGDAGISVGIVRWPLTYPAQPVNGFVLSDRFHELIGSVRELDEGAAHPHEILPLARDAFLEQEDLPTRSPTSEAAAAASSSIEVVAELRDRFYRRAMKSLQARWPTQFTALRYQGLDTVGHYNLRFTQQRDIGDVSDEERRRRQQTIDRYYGYIDDEIGSALSALGPGDLLLVVSGFGMQQPNAIKNLVGRLIGDPVSGTHERAPDGFLLGYGTAVEPGRRQRGSIVDVTPTVLYFLDLPVGRDMDGYARPDLFRSSFTAGRPIAFVPTHNR
jgi:predicted AlkP superfamily phosphohydrolase/phosphomutase